MNVDRSRRVMAQRRPLDFPGKTWGGTRPDAGATFLVRHVRRVVDGGDLVAVAKVLCDVRAREVADDSHRLGAVRRHAPQPIVVVPAVYSTARCKLLECAGFAVVLGEN